MGVKLGLTLREEHQLRVFENRVLRTIFGPTREEVAGGWRRLLSEELHSLYTSPNNIRVIKSRRMRWSEGVTHIGEVRNAYRNSVGEPETKRPLGRPRYRREDNIRIDFTEIRKTG
jgi:hypothetical protein